MRNLKLFIHAAGGLLLAAAMQRFIIAAGSAPVLSLPDFFFFIPLRDAVLLVGGLELATALVCLYGRRVGFQLGLLAWMATNFAVYRLGLVAMAQHPQGTCIGSLTDPLHFARGITGYIMELIPFCLLIGSYAGGIWFWLHDRRLREAAELLKMACPACGVHLKFSRQNVGQKTVCPHCEIAITLRKPDFLKMACFFCKEHIEFPAHATGEKLPCPHCGRDITLKEPA
jgi:hypothetical protein